MSTNAFKAITLFLISGVQHGILKQWDALLEFNLIRHGWADGA